MGGGKAHEFGQATCNQGGLCRFAKAASLDDTAGNGDHIFQSAGDFDADHVIGCIEPKGAA